MRTVVVFAARTTGADRRDVWVHQLYRADGTGCERATVTLPGGMTNLDVDPEELDWLQARQLFQVPVSRQEIE